MANYTRWYRTGSVKVINGSKIVTGYDTFWLTAGLNPGDIFSVDNTTDYEIDSITDNSTLSLKTAFKGATTDGANYSIVRNFTSSMQANVAANTAELLGDLRRYIDSDMQSIHGKSAYEVALANGFVGTEAQWLSSLIGAGEWDTLNERTEVLSYASAGLHNSIFRGKNLGNAFTEAQSAAIKAGTFDDIWLGDYWEINNVRYRIAHIDYYFGRQGEFAKYAHPDLDWGENETSRVLPHHVLIVPDTGLVRDWYNTEEMRDKIYYYSNYYINIRPTLITSLENTFGAEHLMKWPDFTPTAYDFSEPANPFPSAWTAVIGQCELLHDTQLLGFLFPTAGGKRTLTGGGFASHYNKGQRGQFALFRNSPEHWYSAGTYVLQTLFRASDTSGSRVFWMDHSSGGVGCSINPDSQKQSIRPYFCLS